MRQISDTLNDIQILDHACHTATSRLSSLRSSRQNLNNPLVRTASNIEDDEEAILTQRINELKNEKYVGALYISKVYISLLIFIF